MFVILGLKIYHPADIAIVVKVNGVEENDIDSEIFSLGGFAVPGNVIGSP